MRKLYVSYMVIWTLIFILYILSCFDVCGGRFDGFIVSATWPWSLVTVRQGSLLESKFGFSLEVFILRVFIELVIPCVLDFLLLIVVVKVIRKRISGRGRTA